MPRKTPGRQYITTTYTDAEYEAIQKLAAKRKTSLNEVTRDFVIQGLNGTVTEDNIDFLVPIIREQLKSIIEPSIERLASLSAKTCVQSGTAAYLAADAILKWVPPAQREEVSESYESARKKALQYMKTKTNTTE